MVDSKYWKIHNRFAWNDISIEVESSNIKNRGARIKIISNISGSVQSGLLAIMGASGSGKTTLLKAFAGQIADGAHTNGQILYNGESRKSNWFDILGFVGQDDALYEQLTAYETVKYAALFRLKNTQGNLHEKIMQLFHKLSITHIASNIMCSLSGGERKRVMIAIELITDPQIIFLDEPTSGLDNNSALNLIKLLKSISQEGKIVIFSIHQPDDITANEFDQILLLSKGKSVFMGKFDKCEAFFNTNGHFKQSLESFSNFAMRVLDIYSDDHFINILGSDDQNARNVTFKDIKDENQENFACFSLEKIFKTSNATQNTKRHITRKRNTENEHFTSIKPNTKHMAILLARKIKLYFSNKQNIILFILNNLVQMFFVKTFGSMFRKDRFLPQKIIQKRNLFLTLTFIPFVFSAIPIVAGSIFYPEIKQVRREIGLNTYSIGSYFIASIVFETFLYLVSALGFSLGIYWSLTTKATIFGQTKNNLPFLDLMWPGFLIFIGSLLFYILLGSITSSKKLTIFLLGVGFFCNMFPLSELINLLDQTGLIKERFWFCILDIFPSYLISSIVRKRFSQTNKDEPVLNTNKETKFLNKLLKDFRLPQLDKSQYSTEFFLGVDANPMWGIGLFAIICLLYISLAFFCLILQLRPSIRLRLSLEDRSNLAKDELGVQNSKNQ